MSKGKIRFVSLTGSRRSAIDLLHDILGNIIDEGGSMLFTHIMYDSSLSYEQAQRYINFCLDKQLIRKIQENNRVFEITDKGRKVFVQLDNLFEMILND